MRQRADVEGIQNAIYQHDSIRSGYTIDTEISGNTNSSAASTTAETIMGGEPISHAIRVNPYTGNIEETKKIEQKPKILPILPDEINRKKALAKEIKGLMALALFLFFTFVALIAVFFVVV